MLQWRGRSGIEMSEAAHVCVVGEVQAALGEAQAALGEAKVAETQRLTSLCEVTCELLMSPT